MSGIPPQAISAAAHAFSEHLESGEMRPRILARLMLEAAAPHIAAAERERCAQLAERESAHADLQVASNEARIVGVVLRNFAHQLHKETA